METQDVTHWLSMLGRVSAQGGVLVLVILLAQWLFRKQLSPRWRCALWLLVVVRLLLPISFATTASVFNWLPNWSGGTLSTTTSPNHVFVPMNEFLSSATPPPWAKFQSPSAAKPIQSDVDERLSSEKTGAVKLKWAAKINTLAWSKIIFGIWLLGVVVLLAHLIISSMRLAWRFARLEPLTNPAVLNLLDECRSQLDVKTPLIIVETNDVSTPALQGFLHPRLLLPSGFTANFSQRELRFVFLHELAHLKRWDLPMNWLIALLQIIHWFNPLVWLGFARWRSDRELACDALALTVVGVENNRDYGRTILRLLEKFTYRATVPGMVGILEDKRQLRQRILMIANFKPATQGSLLTLILIAVIATGCLTNAKKSESALPTAIVKKIQSPPPRDPKLPFVIDLKPYYASTFAPGEGFDGFSGKQTVDGLPFELGGHIDLFGRTSAERGNSGPKIVSGIKIQHTFDELHLIHDVDWEDPVGQTVATIRLNYNDGTSQNFPIKYGVNVGDWNRLLSEETESLTDPNSKIFRHYGGRDGGTGRMFTTVLINPHPQKMVTTMDLLAGNSWSSYKLAAATAAQSDPQRAVTPALPLNDPPRHFESAVKITVLDQDTGAPIVDADITGYTEISGEGIVIPPLITASNGEAVLKYPMADTATLGLRISKAGYSQTSADWQRGNIPAAITSRLKRGTATIQGVVQDAMGQPVSGATVRFRSHSIAFTLASMTTETDAVGHWSLAGVPADYQDFSVTVTHPNFPQVIFYADGPTRRGFRGKHVSTADFFNGTAVLQLSAGSKITGTVRDQTGKAIANAKVFVGSSNFGNNTMTVMTDASGNFALNNLGLGAQYVTISAPGFAPQFDNLTVEKNNPAMLVTLQPGRLIRGRVMDREHKPLADVLVAYAGLAERNGGFAGQTIQWSTQTDSNGSFVWNDAPAETIWLDIKKGGYMGLNWVAIDTSSTNENHFSLSGTLNIKGSVVDADTGVAIPTFAIATGWPQADDRPHFESRNSKTGTDGHYEIHYDSPIISSSSGQSDFIFKISAPGYAAVESRSIRPDEGDVTWDVKLKKTAATIGTVKTTDGKPAAGVDICLVGEHDYVALSGTQINNQNSDREKLITDGNGHFALPPQTGDYTLVAASSNGIVTMKREDFINGYTLTLQPWGRLEGVLLNHGRPLAGELYFFMGDGTGSEVNLWPDAPAVVDAKGHFVFPHVPPGKVRVQLKQPAADNSWSYLEIASDDIIAGGVNTIQINLEGRPMIGHLQGDLNLDRHTDLSKFQLYLMPDVPGPHVPDEMNTPEKVQKWYQNWEKNTEAGQKYAKASRQQRRISVNPDGTFLASLVAPGKYTLSGSLWQNNVSLAQMDSQNITVPTVSSDNPDAAFDVGALTAKALKHLNVGELAPEFSVKTLDGQPLKLSDFRGKYVLLDFWATWCGPCVAETPNLKATYDAFGKNSDFVMISLSLDGQTTAPKKFMLDNKIQWLQGFLGDWSKDTVTKDYGVNSIPAIFLIGPDGKIIAQNLREQGIESAVANALNTK